ncbi:alpha/beta hydrolase [Candidatus Bipolaricaulota bacterium]|nr:alpha/beta hydrolase [Candidatus Bipolaricaulota bacterium]
MKTHFIPELKADLCYHDFPGQLPAIVTIHGLGVASSSWFPPCVAHPGLRDHRSILIDLLGFGYSDRPADFSYDMDAHAQTVADLLDALQINKCILLGHSMGGSIGILLAHSRPDLVSSLVVAEGNLDPGPGLVSRIITSYSEDEFVDSAYDQFIEDMWTAGARDYAHSVRAADPRAIHRSAVSLIADRSPTYRECLASLPMPKAYLFGSESLPDPDVAALANAGIHVAVVPNSGHDMMGDNPEGFADTVASVIHADRHKAR